MLQRAARIHTSTKDTIQVQVQVQGETFTKYGVRNAAIYMSRWCFEHQQLAGGSISTILPSHHGGFCQPDIDKVPKEHIQAGSNPLVLHIPNNTFSGVEGRDNFTGTTTKYTPLTSTHTVCVWKIQLWQDTGISPRSSCWPFWVDASQYIGVRRKEVFGVFNSKSLFFFMTFTIQNQHFLRSDTWNRMKRPIMKFFSHNRSYGMVKTRLGISSSCSILLMMVFSSRIYQKCSVFIIKNNECDV